MSFTPAGHASQASGVSDAILPEHSQPFAVTAQKISEIPLPVGDLPSLDGLFDFDDANSSANEIKEIGNRIVEKTVTKVSLKEGIGVIDTILSETHLVFEHGCLVEKREEVFHLISLKQLLFTAVDKDREKVIEKIERARDEGKIAIPYENKIWFHPSQEIPDGKKVDVQMPNGTRQSLSAQTLSPNQVEKLQEATSPEALKAYLIELRSKESSENKEISSKTEEHKAPQPPTRNIVVIREPSQRKLENKETKPSRLRQEVETKDPSKTEEKNLQEERVILKLKLEVIEESVTTAFENRIAEDNKANLRLGEHHVTQLHRDMLKT